MKYVRVFQRNNMNFKCNKKKESETNYESTVITTGCQVDI